jgi:hypothetical protein
VQRPARAPASRARRDSREISPARPGYARVRVRVVVVSYVETRCGGWGRYARAVACLPAMCAAKKTRLDFLSSPASVRSRSVGDGVREDAHGPPHRLFDPSRRAARAYDATNSSCARQFSRARSRADRDSRRGAHSLHARAPASRAWSRCWLVARRSNSARPVHPRRDFLSTHGPRHQTGPHGSRGGPTHMSPNAR